MATKSVAREPEVCRFFRLPGELRNYIYAYVLFEPAGLRCQIDPNGVARIYSQSDKRLVQKGTNDDDRAVTDSTNFPSVGSPAGCDDANQLKYVNRQLHQETRGLGILNNELYFSTLPEGGTFVRTLAPEKVKDLRKLYIEKSYTRTEADYLGFSEITKFCSRHPSVCVGLRSIDVKCEDANCVFTFLYAQKIHRDQEDLIGSFFTNTLVQTSVRSHVKKAAEGKKRGILSLPLNFRVLPTQILFSEAAFRENCRASSFMQSMLRAEGDGGLERWVVLMKGIYENGV